MMQGQTTGWVRPDTSQRRPVHCSEADPRCFVWHDGGKIRGIPEGSDAHLWLKEWERSRTNPQGIVWHAEQIGGGMLTIWLAAGQPCIEYRSGHGPHGWVWDRPVMLTHGSPLFVGATRFHTQDRRAIGLADSPVASREWLERTQAGTDVLAHIRQRGV